MTLGIVVGAVVMGGAPGGLAAPAPTVDRAERVTLALSGRTLAIGESGAVKQPAFTYHRARISTVRLTRNRFGFSTRPERTMVFRTSIGPMARPLLAVSADGALVAGTAGRSFSGPVVWCCTPEGEERLMYSDGRTGAPRPRAVAFDREIARVIVSAGATGSVIERLEDGVVSRESFSLLRSPFALGARSLAEVDTGFVLRTPVSTRVGPIVRSTPAFAGPPPPGTIRALKTDGDRIVALVQRARRWEIYRYGSADQTRRLMWRGTRRPRELAVGRGSIAAAVGKTIWAARGNRRLRPQRRGGGRIRAIAVDGTRVAWAEQRGRTQRVRMGRIR